MASQTSWTLDALLQGYQHHQQQTCGLRPRTVEGNSYRVAQFLRAALGEDPIDVTRIGPADVARFIRSNRGRFQPSSLRTICSSLRSFFRYLRAEGLCDIKLEAAIPVVACWKLAWLPRGLTDEQFDRLLASFGRTTLCSRRNYAIVQCLATLGLRPIEVAGLCLEDIDWRAGTVHLRTRKTRRGAVLPLPREAGSAVAEYLLKERPQSTARQVFLRHDSGRRGEAISSGIVTGVVNHALDRAGIDDAPIAGAYLLRHTVAIRLVRRGTGIKEVADFLGHQHLDTTAIYAKVDLEALREVALPWPEVVRS